MLLFVKKRFIVLLIAMVYALSLYGCGPTEETAAPAIMRPDTTSLVIMGTTDLHGYVRSWDYYSDEGGLDYSMSRAATLIDSVRNRHPEALLLDAGDWLQGNPFADYFAREKQPPVHYPLLRGFDYLDYDAVVLGNHEFNYGLAYLNDQIDRTDTPILGGNIFEHGTDEPAYPPYVIREVKGLRVAILGLSTPGSVVWDRPRVEERLDFRDGTETARRFVPELMEEEDADLVVVLAHSGYYGDDSYTDPEVPEENFGKSIAEEIYNVDAMVLGHRHRTFELIREGPSGSLLPVIEAGRWGSHLGVIELEVVEPGGNLPTVVLQADTRMHRTAHAEEHEGLVRIVDEAHEEVRSYVNQPIATTPDTWYTRTARQQPAPAIELIHQVQLEATGAQISAAAAFTTGLEFGPGDIRRGDIARLYPYENTLYTMELTGEQLREFLEYTSRYYLQSEEEEDLLINEAWPGFNYDMLAGVEYELDLRRRPGERVTRLEYEGRPVEDDETFEVAINSYRAEGGGGFDMLADAERLEVIDTSVRDLIIAYLQEREEIRKSDYEADNWRLVY